MVKKATVVTKAETKMIKPALKTEMKSSKVALVKPKSAEKLAPKPTSKADLKPISKTDTEKASLKKNADSTLSKNKSTISSKTAKASVESLAVNKKSVTKPLSKPQLKTAESQAMVKSDSTVKTLGKETVDFSDDNNSEKLNTQKAPLPKDTGHQDSVSTRKPPAPSALNVTPYALTQSEEYMNEAQQAHFSSLLRSWRSALSTKIDTAVSHLKDEPKQFADLNDRASQEEEFNLELKARDREADLVVDIDEALKRLHEGEYGYCEECGIEIGLRRLEASPTATFCIDCKTLAEMRKRQIGG